MLQDFATAAANASPPTPITAPRSLRWRNPTGFHAHALHRRPSTKIYEYLLTGRSILCVARSDNFAFRLVEELGAGVWADPRDQPAIEPAVEQLFRRWQRRELVVSPEVTTETLRRFSRPAAAKELATVLEAPARLTPRRDD